MKNLRCKLTYANVISTLCLFLLLGGGAAFAASQLGKNSVGAKQLKKNAITTAKVKKEAITAAKIKKGTLTGTQINLSKLGTVPSATHAASADSIPQAEPVHLIGAPGQPPFENGAVNSPIGLEGMTFPPAGFYKDAFGVVHLEGAVKSSSGGLIFTLPTGYRPAGGTLLVFAQNEASVIITGSASPGASAGAVIAGKPTILLSGITFRAGS
jgi:hypothetical protein